MFVKSIIPILLLGATWAQAAIPTRVVEAAAEVRVGEAARALETLRGGTRGIPGAYALTAKVIEARALFELGRAEAAAKALIGVREPDLAEPVWRLRLRIAHALGDDRGLRRAAKELLGLPAPSPRTVDEARYWVAARAIAGASSRRRKARKTLLDLAKNATMASLRPRAVARLAEAGDRKALRQLLVEYPATAEARRLVDRGTKMTLSQADREARADRLFIMRAYDLAEPAYAAVAGDPATSPAVAQHARIRMATIRMRMRDGYDQALKHLKAARLGPNPALLLEMEYRTGLVLGHLGRFKEASKAMARYRLKSTRGRRAREAGFQVGRLLHEGGDYAGAVKAYKAFLATKPKDRAQWLWFLGWSHFRGGDRASARRVFADLIPSKNVLIGAKGLYWTARCHLLEGNDRAATKALETLARRAPLTYYGFLGAQLAGKTPGRRVRRHRVPAVPDLVKIAKKLPRRYRKQVRKARLLVAAGYPRLARRAIDDKALLRAARRALGKKRARRFKSQLNLMLERHGDEWKTLTRKERRKPWNENIVGLPRAKRQAIYPPAYFYLARAAGRPHGVSPLWLISHMLQESRFKDRARSHAGALGPMQVLPRTGRRIAMRLGFPSGDFFEDRLYEPGVGLRHAAWYLEALRREYSGNVMLAIGAYNGGPLRMSQHLRVIGEQPFDVIVEEMGAHETRNYTRKVTDHLVRNTEMYADDREREAILKSLALPREAPKSRGETRF